MRKNKKSCSISEFCRNNNFRTLEFYKMLSRHPELAKKLKINTKGERLLNEKAITAAGQFSAKRTEPSRAEVPLPLLPMK